VVRHLLEETGRKKSGEVLAYALKGWLDDSGSRGIELLAQYREELRARGRPVRAPKFKMRQPGTDPRRNASPTRLGADADRGYAQAGDR
jgi:hypothetical protein